jgi:hypothetical protein
MDNKVLKLLSTHATVPLWPEASKILGGSKPLSRGATYAAARSGSIKTFRIGNSIRVPTSWLIAQLALDEPPADASNTVASRELKSFAAPRGKGEATAFRRHNVERLSNAKRSNHHQPSHRHRARD